ncbi:MAG: hypothetical protein MUE60_14840 [Candidatus Eisenbacteria bacterium]|nr:hypothetical protein [Candidatus Eisenbacteria bacterium]
MRLLQVMLVLGYAATMAAGPAMDLVLCREVESGEHHVESRHSFCGEASAEGGEPDSASPSLAARVGRFSCVDLTLVSAAHPTRDPRRTASLPPATSFAQSGLSRAAHPVPGHQSRDMVLEFVQLAITTLLSSTVLII